MELKTGRRAPQASVTGSPIRETPKLPERPTPNYLRPTVIETPEVASVTEGEVFEEKAAAVEVATAEAIETKPAEATPTGPKLAET